MVKLLSLSITKLLSRTKKLRDFFIFCSDNPLCKEKNSKKSLNKDLPNLSQKLKINFDYEVSPGLLLPVVVIGLGVVIQYNSTGWVVQAKHYLPDLLLSPTVIEAVVQ